MDDLIEKARLAFVEAWEGVNDNWPSSERPEGARSRAGIEAAWEVFDEAAQERIVAANRYGAAVEEARDELRSVVDAIRGEDNEWHGGDDGNRQFRSRVQAILEEFMKTGRVVRPWLEGVKPEGFYIIPNSGNPDQDSLWDGIIHPTVEAAQASLDVAVKEWGQDAENYHVVALVPVIKGGRDE